MFTKALARTRAAKIKEELEAFEIAFASIEASPEKEAAQAKLARLHARLNGAAAALAAIFDTDIQTFSGGTDKPEDPE